MFVADIQSIFKRIIPGKNIVNDGAFRTFPGYFTLIEGVMRTGDTELERIIGVDIIIKVGFQAIILQVRFPDERIAAVFRRFHVIFIIAVKQGNVCKQFF